MSTLKEPSNADSQLAVYCDSGGGGRRRGDAVSRDSEDQFAHAVEIVGVPESSNSENKERMESGVLECTVEIVDKVQRHCRICHLSMDAANQDLGFPIELGCSCKEDFAAAHKQCAEAWFKIKGDKTCEICGSVAENVVGVAEAELVELWNDTSGAPSSSQSRNFWQGHCFINFLLAFMVFAFVISLLFHFNVPSKLINLLNYEQLHPHISFLLFRLSSSSSVPHHHIY